MVHVILKLIGFVTIIAAAYLIWRKGNPFTRPKHMPATETTSYAMIGLTILFAGILLTHVADLFPPPQ